MNRIKVAGPLVMPENTPTRVGEEIENISEIYDIPAPRVGMRVYVKSEGKEYIIKSLKMKVIEGVEVPDAAVDKYENVDIKDRVQGKSDKNDSRYDMIFIGDFSKDDIEGFNEALDALTYDTNQPGYGYGYFRAMYGYRNVEIVNTLISSGQNTLVQVVRGVLSIKNGLLVSQGDKYISFTRTHTAEGWDKWRMKNISDMFLLADVEEDVNKFIYVGKFSNLNDAYARCAEVGRENPTLSMLKFDVVAGNIYDSLFILQTYNRNESIITQFCLYGEGQKHSCKVRHIVTDGTVDEWQDIQLYTSYSYENNALYGYKYGKGGGVNKVKLFTIPAATTESAGVMTAEDKQKLEAAGNGATKVTWGSASNMNDFRTAGVYDIYGERTNLSDNLPILNSNPGHSIAARLYVVASTLRPANNEICVTQFLMLSNRKGGDGNMYVRTYNENNSPAADWWTPWQKLQGIREGYIFTDTIQVNPDGGVQLIEGVTGLNNMIDNGIYNGIYTDDPTFQTPTFIDTFTLIVINNYAVASKDSRLKRTISQLKYAINAITNQASVKKRTKTDGDTKWSDWEDVGTSEVNHEIITEIKSRAVEFNSLEVEELDDGIGINYDTLDGNGGSVEIPVATTKRIGVMSAADKVALDKAVEDIADEITRAKAAEQELEERIDNIPLATTESDGLMSAEDKAKLDKAVEDIADEITRAKEAEEALDDKIAECNSAVEGTYLNNMSCTSRASIKYENSTKTLTIGTGYMYLYNGKGKQIVYNSTAAYTYTFSGSRVVVFDTVDKVITDRHPDSALVTDIWLLWYDNVGGLSGGVLYRYVKEEADAAANNTIKQNPPLDKKISAGAVILDNLVVGAPVYIQVRLTGSLCGIGVYDEDGNRKKLLKNISKGKIGDVESVLYVVEEGDAKIKEPGWSPLYLDYALYLDTSSYNTREGVVNQEKYINTQIATSLGAPIKSIIHGATASYPQNNLVLYKNAAKRGMLFWECDVRPCSDGYVLSHDDDMYQLALDADGNQLTQGKWLCSQKTVTELKTLKTGINKGVYTIVKGYENVTVATVDEFVVLAKVYGACPVIEIKFTATEAQIREIYGIVKRHGMVSKTMFLLYENRVLHGQYFQAVDENANLIFCGEGSIATSDLDAIISYKNDRNIMGLSYYISAFTDEVLNKALDAGLLIGTWSATGSSNIVSLVNKGYSMFTINDMNNNSVTTLRDLL